MYKSPRKYTKLLLIATVGFTVLGTAVNASAAEFQIKRNHIKYDGQRYFVKNSDELKLGSYGVKKSPATQQNYLLQHADFSKIGKVKIGKPQFSSRRSDTTLIHNGAFSMPIKLVKLGISTKAYSKMIKEQKCSFVKETIANKGTLLKNLNASGSAKSFLKNSNSSRIVYEVLRAKSCMIKKKSKKSLNVKGEVTVKKAGVKVKGDDTVANETEVFFGYGKGTVIGYRMLKLKWNKKNKNKRTKIVGYDDDGQSMN